MPAVAAVTPPTRTAATTARAIQDMPRGPLARRKLNPIDALRLFLRKSGRNQVPRARLGAGFTGGQDGFPGASKETGAAAALGVTATAPGLLPCPRQGGVARCPAVPCTTFHGCGSRLVQQGPGNFASRSG